MAPTWPASLTDASIAAALDLAWHCNIVPAAMTVDECGVVPAYAGATALHITDDVVWLQLTDAQLAAGCGEPHRIELLRDVIATAFSTDITVIVANGPPDREVAR